MPRQVMPDQAVYEATRRQEQSRRDFDAVLKDACVDCLALREFHDAALRAPEAVGPPSQGPAGPNKTGAAAGVKLEPSAMHPPTAAAGDAGVSHSRSRSSSDTPEGAVRVKTEGPQPEAGGAAAALRQAPPPAPLQPKAADGVKLEPPGEPALPPPTPAGDAGGDHSSRPHEGAVRVRAEAGGAAGAAPPPTLLQLLHGRCGRPLPGGGGREARQAALDEHVCGCQEAQAQQEREREGRRFTPPKPCLICLEPCQAGVLCPAGHCVCGGCAGMYVASQTDNLARLRRNGGRLQCPDPGCAVVIPDAAVHAALDAVQVAEYEKLKVMP